MRQITDVKEGVKLEDYAAYAALLALINDFQQEAALLVPALKNTCIWMVNSTAQGGGVAEMMPRMLSIMRQVGVQVEWLVLESDEEDFFKFTKKLHNLIHGQGDINISGQERKIFQQVSEANAQALLKYVKDQDVVVLHDPQPLGMVKVLKEQRDVKVIWRCHIGLDISNKQTETVWSFLNPYFEYIDHFVFSAPEYIPKGLAGNVSIIFPGIDPLSHKNRELETYKLGGIFSNAGLLRSQHPKVTPDFKQQVKRLQPDGSFAEAANGEDIGLLFRPIITQVSRWDRLKGFLPLVRAFVDLKKNVGQFCKVELRAARIVETARLVLAGPDPDYVSDDPEGEKVLAELASYYQYLDENLQKDIAICKLPMYSVKENALIVNALQRSSFVVVQNSLREGFGLTATEAMWKRIPVMASNACGLRHQIRNNIEGFLISDPEDQKEVARQLCNMLGNHREIEKMGFQAQKRVIDNFLIFHQIEAWLKMLSNLLSYRMKSGSEYPGIGAHE